MFHLTCTKKVNRYYIKQFIYLSLVPNNIQSDNKRSNRNNSNKNLRSKTKNKNHQIINQFDFEINEQISVKCLNLLNRLIEMQTQTKFLNNDEDHLKVIYDSIPNYDNYRFIKESTRDSLGHNKGVYEINECRSIWDIIKLNLKSGSNDRNYHKYSDDGSDESLDGDCIGQHQSIDQSAWGTLSFFVNLFSYESDKYGYSSSLFKSFKDPSHNLSQCLNVILEGFKYPAKLSPLSYSSGSYKFERNLNLSVEKLLFDSKLNNEHHLRRSLSITLLSLLITLIEKMKLNKNTLIYNLGSSLSSFNDDFVLNIISVRKDTLK